MKEGHSKAAEALYITTIAKGVYWSSWPRHNAIRRSSKFTFCFLIFYSLTLVYSGRLPVRNEKFPRAMQPLISISDL